MEIKAKCKYDKEAAKALTYILLNNEKNPKKTFLSRTIFYFVLCLALLCEVIFFKYTDFRFVLIVGIIALLVLLAVQFIGYFLLPKRRYNTLGSMKDAENEYLFCSDVVKISTEYEKFNGQSEIEYSLFSKAFETSRYLFLFCSNNMVYLVDKLTISSGEFEDIRQKLMHFIKDYNICNY